MLKMICDFLTTLKGHTVVLSTLFAETNVEFSWTVFLCDTQRSHAGQRQFSTLISLLQLRKLKVKVAYYYHHYDHDHHHQNYQNTQNYQTFQKN